MARCTTRDVKGGVECVGPNVQGAMPQRDLRNGRWQEARSIRKVQKKMISSWPLLTAAVERRFNGLCGLEKALEARFARIGHQEKCPTTPTPSGWNGSTERGSLEYSDASPFQPSAKCAQGEGGRGRERGKEGPLCMPRTREGHRPEPPWRSI